MSEPRDAVDLSDLIDHDDLTIPFWNALRAGRLEFQRCRECSAAWLPPQAQCPNCWKAAWDWEPASGSGRLISWVIYHRAYHPAFIDRLPYNVAVVELKEGPRVLTNIVSGAREFTIDAPVELRIEREGDLALARFAICE
jgi:uncharacterized protein